jgi:hypothetical protein
MVGAVSSWEGDHLFGRWFLGLGSLAEGRVPEAGVEAVLLGAEGSHLAGGVLSVLLKCGVVREWTKASKR